jgi:hypothetical protein
MAVVLVLALVTCAAMAGIWRNSSGMRRLRAVFLPSQPPPIPSPNNPSKEYIYGGGKLIATEAPVPLLPPANVTATTRTDWNPAQITISWVAVSGADHYEVEKTTNLGGSYSSVDSHAMGTTLNDGNVTPVTAYLYRVRAVDAAGNVSSYSNFDLATAISFIDDTLTAQSTDVKAVHITQLRQAVDAVRATANLGAASWGGGITPYSTLIFASHIQDLRTNLDQARSQLGLPPCTYTDNSVAALQASYIKKEHIEQLRNCVK